MATGLSRIDADTRCVLTTDYKYPYVIMEYSGGNLIYKGTNKTHGISTADENWIIYKYTWSDSNLTQIEMLIGAWDDRVTLNWA